MKRLNVVMLVHQDGERMLMCRRTKAPYLGLFNFVGGKVEAGEDGLHAAYRELREETGVTAADTALRHVMTLSYPAQPEGYPCYALEVYAGCLRHDVTLVPEQHPLCWMPIAQDYFDLTRYAGEGSIGHIVETVRRYMPYLLQPQPLEVSLAPFTAQALPVIAHYHGTDPAKLQGMLAEAETHRHEGRWYELLCVRMNGCMVGLASLCEQEDGMVSDGLEVFPPFRQCAIGRTALVLLMNMARQHGYTSMTAQVRVNNLASLKLHERLGFTRTAPSENRRGRMVHALRIKL